jgi:hypothetical protein
MCVENVKELVSISQGDKFPSKVHTPYVKPPVVRLRQGDSNEKEICSIQVKHREVTRANAKAHCFRPS